jgi:NADH-quinone oxidoreductase subunit N
VPFHFYAPDVYQGTSHGNAALLSVVPKVAGLAALIRIVVVPMVGEGSYLEVLAKVGWQLSLVLAVLTMTVGNLLALCQQNIRRMLAYSAIAHAGYMLIGLSVAFAVAGGAHAGPAANGLGATLFYLLVYSLATAGVFAGLTYLSSHEKQLSTVDEIAGLARSNPVTAAALAVCLFSLTGLPPLSGFWGKFVLISGALSVRTPGMENLGSPDTLWYWFIGLSVVAVVNAAISAGYYLRLVAAMFFRESISINPARGGFGASLAMILCAAGVLVTGAFPVPWLNAAQRAANAARVSFIHRVDATQTAEHTSSTQPQSPEHFAPAADAPAKLAADAH